MTKRYCLTLDLKDDPKLIAEYMRSISDRPSNPASDNSVLSFGLGCRSGFRCGQGSVWPISPQREINQINITKQGHDEGYLNVAHIGDPAHHRGNQRPAND